MIQKIQPPKDIAAPNAVGYRITGEITKKRRKAVSEDLQRAIDAHGAVRLLLIVEPYPDIVIGADGLYENLRFVMVHAGAIQRLALVSQKLSEKTYMAIFGLFSGIPTEHFHPDHLQAAWKWVAE
jgi:hypothetical protein